MLTFQVSNICDRGYIGPEPTLQIFGPLLKIKAKNPSATLLMLFLNAAEEDSRVMDFRVAISGISDIGKYLPVNREMLQDRNRTKADFLKLFGALRLFRDFDKLFDGFMTDYRFEEIGKVGGVKMKLRNTIVEPWPLRLKPNATKEEFDTVLASGHAGSERYVEWESIA
jgi:hypothetical protein